MWKVLSGGQFARVRWDIDGRSQRVGVANLQLEAEEGWLEPPAEGRRVFQLFSYSSSSEGFDKESSSCRGSDDDASESESEDESDIQSQSANGGRKRVLHKYSAQMPRKESPAEVDLNNGKVTAHGLEWKFVDDVSVDAYKDNRHKPKLRVAGPASISVLDFWLLFFRSESIGEILQETNAIKAQISPETHFKGRAVQGNWASLCFDTLCPQATLGLLGHCEHWWPLSNTSIRCSFRNGQRSLWPNTWQLFLLVMAQTCGFQQGHSSTYVCAPAQRPIWSTVLCILFEQFY